MNMASGSSVLDIVILARDEASGVFKNIGASSQAAASDIEGSASKAQGALDEVGAAGQRAGSGVAAGAEEGRGAFAAMTGQFVAGMAMFTAGQKILDGLNEAVHEGVQANMDWQTQQAVAAGELKLQGTAAGITMEQVTGLAEATQKNTAVARESVLAGENQLLTFGNISSNMLPKATDMTIRLASSMASGAIPNTQQMTDAAKQLGIALDDPSKGYTRLHRNGVDFTAQQVEEMKQLQAHGDLLGAQQIIMDGVSQHYASLSVQSGTWTFMTAQLRNTFNDFIGVLINKGLPMLQRFGDFLASHREVLALVTGAVVGLSVAIGVALVAALWAIVAPALAAVAAMWPLIVVGAALGLIAYEVVTHWNVLKAFFSGFINDVKQWFGDVVKFIKDHWDLLAGILLGPVGLIVAEIIKHWSDIKQGFLDVWNGIVDFFKGLPSKILGFVSNFGSLLYNAGRDIIQGLVNGVKDFAHMATDAVKNVGDDVVKGFKNLLGIHSPSTVFAEAGKNIGQGLADGITGTKDLVKTATNALMGNASGTINVSSTASSVNRPAGVSSAASLPTPASSSANGNSGLTINAGGVTVNIGMYAGTQSEKQRIATEIWQALMQIARAHNMANNIPNFGIRPI